MVYNPLKYFTPYLILLLLVPFSLWAIVKKNDVRPVIDVPRLERSPALENFLEMAPIGKIERQMVKVKGFTQRQPKDGEPSSQRSEVYLGYDDKNLYVVFLAFDSEPDKVRARMNRREDVFSDDVVQIMIDTFQDQRRAYAFVTNPLGVQWDAIWTEGQGFDRSFDTLWHSKGKITDKGYIVWMAIPFKSLRFPPVSEQSWGIIFSREIRRGSVEKSFWPHVSVKIDGRLNQAASLTGLRNISPGRNVQLIPYGTFRSFRLLDRQGPFGFQTNRADTDAGLDAKLVFNDNIVIDATANPDFSQVESDEPQITVNQRFEVFFPEKRPFFLENANFFRSPINLVFTRRIADPQFGVRLTGKTGHYAIGALLMDDESPGKGVSLQGKRAYFGILRVTRDIMRQSTIGLIYADREFDGSYNRVGGIDGRLKLNPNWILIFQGLMSSTKLAGGTDLNGPAFDVVLNRNGRKFNYHLHYTDIGQEFRTETGFIQRLDIRRVHQSVNHRFRPEGKFLISWGPGLFVSRTWNHEGIRLNKNFNIFINAQFTGQTNIRFFYNETRELLQQQDFSLLPENHDFQVTSQGFYLNSSFIKEISFNGSFSAGKAINFVPPSGQAPLPADRVSARFNLSVRPNSLLKIDNRYIFLQFSDPVSNNKIFANHIFRAKWNWQFSPKFSLRFILQYNITLPNSALTSLQTTKNFNMDFLVTYLINPWTALYFGMNSNYQNLNLIGTGDSGEVVRTQNDFLNDSRQIFVKYSYLFRF